MQKDAVDTQGGIHSEYWGISEQVYWHNKIWTAVLNITSLCKAKEKGDIIALLG